MSRARRYAKFVGVMVGQSTVQRLANVFTNMVLARALDVTGFGIYNVVATTAFSAYGMLRLGSESALLVQTAALARNGDTQSRGDLGDLIGAGLLLLLLAGAAGLAICVAFADAIAAQIFGDPSLAVWVRIGGVSTLLMCLSQFCSATLAGFERFADYAKVVVAMAIVQAALATVGGLFFGLAGAVIALLAVQTTTVLALAAALRRALRADGVHMAFRNLWRRTRELLVFGIPFQAAATVWIPVSYYVQGVLARHAGIEALGYLRAIISVTTLVTFVPSSLATTVAVMLSSATQPAQFASDATRTIKLVALFALLIAPIVIMTLPWLIPILFGSAYSNIAAATGIALTGSVLASLSQAVEVTMLSAKLPSVVLGLTVVRGLALLALGPVLIARYGLAGYLLADLAGHLLLLIAAYGCSYRWLQQHVTARPWIMKASAPWLLLLAYSASLVAQLDTRSVVGLMFGATVTAAIWIWVFRTVLDHEERQAVFRLVQIRTFRDVVTPVVTD